MPSTLRQAVAADSPHAAAGPARRLPSTAVKEDQEKEWTGPRTCILAHCCSTRLPELLVEQRSLIWGGGAVWPRPLERDSRVRRRASVWIISKIRSALPLHYIMTARGCPQRTESAKAIGEIKQ